jgi:hypothetical protein
MKTRIYVLAVAVAGMLSAGALLAQMSRESMGAARQPNMGPTPQGYEAKGSGGALVAKQVSKEEAAKKYPAKNGTYPPGERDPHKPSGVVTSPYPPHTEYDCSNVPHGGLVLDTRVNKVFLRP